MNQALVLNIAEVWNRHLDTIVAAIHSALADLFKKRNLSLSTLNILVNNGQKCSTRLLEYSVVEISNGPQQIEICFCHLEESTFASLEIVYPRLHDGNVTFGGEQIILSRTLRVPYSFLDCPEFIALLVDLLSKNEEPTFQLPEEVWVSSAQELVD